MALRAGRRAELAVDQQAVDLNELINLSNC